MDCETVFFTPSFHPCFCIILLAKLPYAAASEEDEEDMVRCLLPSGGVVNLPVLRGREDEVHQILSRVVRATAGGATAASISKQLTSWLGLP